MNYLHTLLFGLYPYLAGSVFLIGSLLRFDHGQYTWKTGSSQMLSSRRMRLASPLFHVGILVIFFGHLVGLLTPHWVYAPFISAGTKQVFAILVGGLAGIACLIGGAMLLHRRFTDPRVKASSSFMDNLIIVLLVVQVTLGLLTIPAALHHLDGGVMIKLAEWAQAIVFFQGGAATHLEGIGFIYHLHILVGLTIVLVFPFTRLVHAWSAPLGYLGRRYQIVRRRA
ncbi:respiratory nitrate reductase subunit gamma [Halomonas litopenaei]|uniref:nitrate reductase (quinone) n=3 Tax=Halomonas TaxID=2745 RepID=A0AAU7KCE7_9GAMM|nr:MULTISPECIES: respiratory nitrate reductase subunit gamma [Halomonas]MBR9772605.1 respiratory nitrate reductase subunit gamma [Gammaproteobacteria bacterium]MAR73463.1 respiratory nitrate reductase subunit gamma [Halomonas sp.]MBS8267321.1 respiratory nitrate reductase subunit gamma [Halomonas litopenaei]MBY5941017.1 respiratory nitrate reductase subunit gamma [Halomonas sp. DP5N14-9]MBY6111335.1 respiratory nitrate reductase subunit gamma [Halomonas sp. DP1Y21-3]